MGEVKRFTRSEVAAYNGKNNSPVYVVYKDSVYDVTKYTNESDSNFLLQHPGGPEVILDEAGTDATKAFDEVGHSSDARSIMTKYKVGEIVEEEKRFDANGKKKKKVVAAAPEESSRGLCSVITCGLVG
ncbi:Uncharacterized protein OBRU01_07951 [Operophtera brumata]|uniref:Cytochrome b5 heme-binding domain-containing protein n=1 Tax=Operophtera brumata TaxID=104452 RepID=A0A0L7LI02_OPEBR|nr:Uncharacterized protein OBRU01_07951 [Operophtera brumata]